MVRLDLKEKTEEDKHIRAWVLAAQSQVSGTEESAPSARELAPGAWKVMPCVQEDEPDVWSLMLGAYEWALGTWKPGEGTQVRRPLECPIKTNAEQGQGQKCPLLNYTEAVN